MIRKSPFDKSQLSIVLERVNLLLKEGKDEDEIKTVLSDEYRPNELGQLFEQLGQLHKYKLLPWWRIANAVSLILLIILFSVAAYMWLNMAGSPELAAGFDDTDPDRNFLLTIAWILLILFHLFATLRPLSKLLMFSTGLFIVLGNSSMDLLEVFDSTIHFSGAGLVLVALLLSVITFVKWKAYVGQYLKIIENKSLRYIELKYRKI